MKTIEELNERILWRFLKFFYFLITWVVIVILCSLIYTTYNFYPKDTLDKLKNQIEIYGNELKKFKYNEVYDYLDDFRTYKYSLKDFEYSYLTPFKNLYKDLKFSDIKNSLFTFAKIYLWVEVKDNFWKEKFYWMIFTHGLAIILLYIIITFLIQRSIYYIILWKFNPPEK